VLRRLVASWLDPKRGRPAAPARSGLGVPGLFEARRLELLDGEIDWSIESLELHAMEYLACLDDAEVVSLVDGWIAERGSNFETNALATRCAVWMQQVSARTLPRSFVARASASIAEQVRSLESSEPSIESAKALLFAGRFFVGAEAERWSALGRERLAFAIRASILDDGVHVARDASRHARTFSDLLECRFALEDVGVLDRMAQAAADLFPSALATQCLRVHARLGGRSVEPRPVFAFGSAGRFGVRGDESALLVRDDRTFEWSLGGLPFVLASEDARANVETLRAGEGSLEVRLARRGGSWTLRAGLERIEIEDEVVERTSEPVRSRLRLHPEVAFDLSSDARRLHLRRKGILAIVDGPNPMRVVPTPEGVEIVVHHGIAPCTGELSLRHVPSTFGDDALDALPGLAGKLPRAHDQSVLDLVHVRPV
jgi:hypothetical protein